MYIRKSLTQKAMPLMSIQNAGLPVISPEEFLKKIIR